MHQMRRNAWGEGDRFMPMTTGWEMHYAYDRDDPMRNRNMMWTARAEHAIEKAAARDEPFFLAYGTVSTHDPFCYPKEFADRIDPRKLTMPATYRLRDSLGRPVPMAYYATQRGWSDGTASWPSTEDYLSRENVPADPWAGRPLPPDPADMDEAVARKLLQSYYGAVAHADYLLGRVLDKLEATGQLDDTVIAVVSDHGFQLLDHDIFNKTTQFRQSTRSVMMLSVPGQTPQRFTQPVELLDVYPTL